MTARLARVSLLVLVVGLVLHNLAMALLWQAGVRDTALDAVSAWKDVLLLAALVLALAAGSIPQLFWADRLALAYGGLVVVYAVAPQSWLGGDATGRGELYALRHHLLPLGAYVLGRLVVLDRSWWRRIGLTLIGIGVGLAAWGLVDVYLVPFDWWRDSGVPDWFSEQLGLAYRCLSGLPENWILNTDEESPARRLVSTFLSPLATAYALVVVLLLLAAMRPRRWTVAAGAIVYAGLLWTHTRAAFIALPVGLLVLAVLRRSWTPAVLAAGSIAATVGFVALFPTIGPTTTYTADELTCLRAQRGRRGEPHRRPVLDGRELDVEPPERTPRGAPDGRAPSVGLRARQLRRVRVPHRRHSEGGRVDLHGARCRHRRARPGGLRGVARRAVPRPPAALALARRVGRGRRGARAADRRDRHPLAVGRGLRALRRGAPPRAGRPAAGERGLNHGFRRSSRQEAPEPKLARRSTSASSTMWPSRPT